MPRTIGPAQQAILDALAASDHLAMTTAELVAACTLSERRVRAATDALERRQMIVVTRENVGWRADVGRLIPRRSWYRDAPTVMVVEAGERWPTSTWFKARQRTEFVHAGMPTYGRLYWLPEAHEELLRRHGLISDRHRHG